MNDMFVLVSIIVVLAILCVFFSYNLLALRKYLSKKKLIEVFSQEFVASLSEDFRFLYVSLSSVNTIEMSPSLLQGRYLKEFVHPDDLDLLVRSLEAPMSDDRLKTVVFRCRHGSEGWCWVEMYGKKIRWESKRKVLVCYFKNVDSIIKLRSDYNSIEKRLQIFLKLSTDIVWEFDVEKRELNILTPIVYERHRIPSRTPCRISLDEMMPAEDLRLIENVINARVQHFSEYGRDVPIPEEIYIRLFGIDGSRVWYSVRGLLDKNLDGRLMFFGSGHMVDHTLVNKTSPDIKSYLFDSIMSLPYLRVFWVDQEQIFLGCNQTFASDLGQYNASKVIGESMHSFSMNVTLGTILKENTLRSIKTKQTCSGKAEIFIGPNSVRHILFYSFTPLEDETKSVSAVLGIYLITNLEKLFPLN